MNPEELSQFSDQELLNEVKKIKSAQLINATLIGFMFGVIIYGVAKNYLGFFGLIPIFLVFRVFNNPKAKAHKNQVERLLKERDLQ